MKIQQRKDPATSSKQAIPLWLRASLVALGLAGVFFLGYGASQSGVFQQAEENVAPALEEDIAEIASALESEAQLYRSNGLETLTLDIPFESMQALEAVREEALALGFRPQSDDEYVPASIRVGENGSVDVELRLKGDWIDHYRGDKWSFRIHVEREDEAVMGMRRFSIQDPNTRNFLYEWIYHQAFLREGILTTRYDFINVVINGEYKGIYAIEESFAEELLVSQGRETGIIYRLSEDMLWERREQLRGADQDPYFPYYVEQMGYFMVTNGYDSPLDIYRQGIVEEDEALAAQWVEGEEMLYSYLHGYLSSSEVLEEELWGRFYAIADGFAASHSVVWHNLRFYYNPVTGLIEPIGYDGNAMNDHYAGLTPNDQYSLLLENPGIQRAYVAMLTRLSDPAYFDTLQADLGAEVQRLHDALAVDYPGIDSTDTVWYKFRLRSNILRHNLDPVHLFHGGYALGDDSDGSVLQLGIVNVMAMPLELVEIAIGDHVIPASPAWCDSDQCRLHTVSGTDHVVMLSQNTLQGRSTQFTIPLTGQDAALLEAGEDVPVTVRTRLYGSDALFEEAVYRQYVPVGVVDAARPSVTLDEALAAHPFLWQAGDSALVIPRGEWDVRGDLILPEDVSLLIVGGTSLRFEPGAVMIVNGRLTLSGNEDQEILLTALDDDWGGLAVYNGGDRSTLSYVRVEKTTGISRGGWQLPGGVTFYMSPTTISFSSFTGDSPGGALEIIQSDFSLDHVAIRNSGGDGMVSSHSTGTISYTSFSDTQGAGLAAAGSVITLNTLTFTDSDAAGLSATRNSRITATNLTFRRSGIGILVTDLSELSLRNATLANLSHGLVACQVDPAYGPGFIEASGLTMNGDFTQAMAQTGSTISIDQREIGELPFTLDDLMTGE